MAWIEHRSMASGYWGEVTSSLIWCEEKYKWSKYIAEPVNTFSNIFFVLLSMYGAKKTLDERLPMRFMLCYLGTASVGVGSFLFHATLKHEAQLLDELPMIYTSALLTYCVLETTPGYGKPRFRIMLPALLMSMVIFVTVAYVYLGNPVFHQVCYAIIQLISTLQVMKLLYSSNSNISEQYRSQIKQIFGIGSTIFLTSFAIWNVDNIYCNELRKLRHQIGYPWAILLEGHSWWHIGTGYGAYLLIVASEMLMLAIKEKEGNFELQGPAVLPHLKRIRPYKGGPRHSGNGLVKHKKEE